MLEEFRHRCMLWRIGGQYGAAIKYSYAVNRASIYLHSQTGLLRRRWDIKITYDRRRLR
jgi:hypothetical protein